MTHTLALWMLGQGHHNQEHQEENFRDKGLYPARRVETESLVADIPFIIHFDLKEDDWISKESQWQ